MSGSESFMVSCTACGKRYRWRVDLAGRKVRCTCSQIMDMPADAPSDPAATPAPQTPAASLVNENIIHRGSGNTEGYELGDDQPKPNFTKCPGCNQAVADGAVICIKCGFHMEKGKRIATAVQQVPDTSAIAQHATSIKRDDSVPSGAMLAAQAMSGHRARTEDDGSVLRRYKFQEFYLPIGLIIFGIILTFWRYGIMADFDYAASRIVVGAVAVAIQLLIMVPLMLVSVMIAAKLADIAFGAAHTALLKLAAIAIGPMALADLILEMIGFGSIFLTTFMYGVAVCPFLAVMFDLDYFETMLTFVLMLLVRFVFSSLIVLVLFGFLFG